MSSSLTLKCESREKVGSRASRKLRAAGRIPASVPTDGSNPHLNIHLDEDEFLTSRRHHVHLYDLEIGSDLETTLVREIQWDALGDRIVHVEFRRVQRGVETESEVELSFYGQVKDGVLNHGVTHITIRSIPSMIPDSIEVSVEGMESGTHIKAGDLILPEGVSLAVDPELEVAVIAGIKIAAESIDTELAEGDEAAPADEGETPPATEES